MTNWWEIDTGLEPLEPPKPRAVAYYRHSAQDRQENSIALQQDQIRELAEQNGVEIACDFADAVSPASKLKEGSRSLRQKEFERALNS